MVVFVTSEDRDRVVFHVCKFAYGKPVSFSTVAAFLRLGTKYQIPHLRNDGIHRLENIFAIEDIVSFREKLHAVTQSTSESSPNHRKNPIIYDLEMFHAIAVVNLAHTYDIVQLLPGAFYWCAACLDTEFLVKGYKDDDGVLWKFSQDKLCWCLEGRRNLRVQELCHHEVVIKDLLSEAKGHPMCLEVTKEVESRHRQYGFQLPRIRWRYRIGFLGMRFVGHASSRWVTSMTSCVGLLGRVATRYFPVMPR